MHPRVLYLYPYDPLETNVPPFNKSFLAFDKLSDNYASDHELSLSMSVAANKEISKVILMLCHNAILVVYKINVHYWGEPE